MTTWSRERDHDGITKGESTVEDIDATYMAGSLSSDERLSMAGKHQEAREDNTRMMSPVSALQPLNKTSEDGGISAARGSAGEDVTQHSRIPDKWDEIKLQHLHLPDGWEARKTEDGTPYYYHNGLQHTQWDLPNGESNTIVDLVESTTAHSSVWEEYATDDGIPFWHNAETEESRWTPPAKFPTA